MSDYELTGEAPYGPKSIGDLTETCLSSRQAIEVPSVLVGMDGIIGGVVVQDDFLGRLVIAVQKGNPSFLRVEQILGQ